MNTSQFVIRAASLLIVAQIFMAALWAVFVYYTFNQGFVGGMVTTGAMLWVSFVTLPRIIDAWSILKMAVNSHEQRNR